VRHGVRITSPVQRNILGTLEYQKNPEGEERIIFAQNIHPLLVKSKIRSLVVLLPYWSWRRTGCLDRLRTDEKHESERPKASNSIDDRSFGLW
jgi:hypothetical protein